MGEVKGMLHQNLGLLTKQNVEAAVSLAASKGEKVTEEDPIAQAQGEQVNEPLDAQAYGEEVVKEKQAAMDKGKGIMMDEPTPKEKKIEEKEKLLGASIVAVAKTARVRSVFETLHVAASGLTVEDFKRQQLEDKEEASLRLARELEAEEVKEADAERQLLASQKKDILEVVKQRQVDFDVRKAEEDASLRKLKEEFLDKTAKRKRPERITDIKPSMVQSGKVTNVVLTREGSLNTHYIKNIKATSLGASKWMEVHNLIKGRVGANYSGLHNICSEFLGQIRMYEKKFAIKDSILKEAGKSITSLLRKTPARKQRTTGTFSFSTRVLPSIEGDALLNLNLPSRVIFQEGLVLKNNAGIFYSNQHGDEKFFHLSEISKASTKFLLAIRKHCIKTSNDSEFIKIIDQELTKAERVATQHT